MIKNLALIPARKNSKGIKNKNRILFDNITNFIKKLKFIDKIIVSSDDDIILKKSVKYSFTNHHRKSSFAKDNTSIKKTITNICNEMKLDKNDIIWLFYLPIVNRVKKDFENAFKLTKKNNFKSICSFIEADYKYHPFYSWKFKKNHISKFLKNNVFRRQDLPPAYFHFHYICCFKIGELKNLNSELINEKTIPFKIKFNSKSTLEIDNKEDLKNFKKNV